MVGQDGNAPTGLDVVRFFERMKLDDQELVEVNYYSARPMDDQQAADNQDVLFSANRLNPKFKLHLGRYKKKKISFAVRLVISAKHPLLTYSFASMSRNCCGS